MLNVHDLDLEGERGMVREGVGEEAKSEEGQLNVPDLDLEGKRGMERE